MTFILQSHLNTKSAFRPIRQSQEFSFNLHNSDSVNQFFILTICLISDANKFSSEVKLLPKQTQTKPTSRTPPAPTQPQTNQAKKKHTKTKPADTPDNTRFPNTHTMKNRFQLLYVFQRD